VGELLGAGSFGRFTLWIYVLYSFLLGKVFSGRDIRMGRDVAVKLEDVQESNPKLTHKYNIYRNISGISRIPKAHWYGREGSYSILVLDWLGSTFDTLARESALDTNAIFTYVAQMVCRLYYIFYTYIYIFPSFQSLSRCTTVIMFTSMSNQTISH